MADGVRLRFNCFVIGLRNFYNRYYNDKVQFIGGVHFHLRLLLMCFEELLPDIDRCVDLSQCCSSDFFVHLECMLRVVAIENTNVFYAKGIYFLCVLFILLVF